MPRYFFHIHDGRSIPDQEGTELPGLQAAQKEAVKLAGEMLASDPAEFWNCNQWQVEVQDETGLVLFTLDFIASMARAVLGRPI